MSRVVVDARAMTVEQAYAVLDAMTPRERFAFELAVEYGCRQMAETLWRRAMARVEE